MKRNPIFFKKLPKSSKISFKLKKWIFKIAQKVSQFIWATFVVNLLPKSFIIRPTVIGQILDKYSKHLVALTERESQREC